MSKSRERPTHYRSVTGDELRPGHRILYYRGFRTIKRIELGNEPDGWVTVVFVDGKQRTTHVAEEIDIACPPLYADGEVPDNWDPRPDR